MEVFIKKGKEHAIRRFHPWIFSGAIFKTIGNPTDGSVVKVFDFQSNILGVGHYYTGSIAVKMLSFQDIPIDQNFWNDRILKAKILRDSLGLENTNCYRLVHGEGDNLPGLIIDIYKDIAVFQAHSIGMHQARMAIVEALKRAFNNGLKAIYDKSSETLPKNYAQNTQNEFLFGQVEVPYVVSENYNKFEINWITGQKTGFFLDQRDNRLLLTKYVKSKTVLNCFCYSGGFSVYALAAGAKKVISVDSSAKAIDLANSNIELNFPKTKNSQTVVSDVMEFLKNLEELQDVIILDPPAYAKSLDARHRALQAYKRLNIMGLQKVKSGGLLFTFSCSQVVDRELFYNTIVAAGIEAGRNIKVLHHLSQGADHPVNFYHPEGHYLKGLVLYVE